MTACYLYTDMLYNMQITYSPFHLTNNDGTLSLFSNMNDMVVALSGYVKHSGWEQVAMISEIHEIFLKV